MDLETIVAEVNAKAARRQLQKMKQPSGPLFSFDAQSHRDSLRAIKDGYYIAIAGTLSPRFDGAPSRSYTCSLPGQDFIGKINCLLSELLEITQCVSKIFSKQNLGTDYSVVAQKLEKLREELKTAIGTIIRPIARDVNDRCECGAKITMGLAAIDVSCPSCARIFSGSSPKVEIARDPPKQRQTSYDILRHYKYWIERLQGLKSCALSKTDLKKINDAVAAQNLHKSQITCENVRAILKEPAVALTHLNDLVPYLVKILGGETPPMLTAAESKACAAKFVRIMEIYDTILVEGINKSYYPYFIYKICEQIFFDVPDKLRILNFIHLQSRETVIKNDKLFKQICDNAAPEDDLVYRPTDPSRVF